MLVLYTCGLYFENIKHFSILHLNEFESSVCVRGKVCALSANKGNKARLFPSLTSMLIAKMEKKPQYASHEWSGFILLQHVLSQ